MNLSYWEIKHWLKNIDFTIVGSGIVGLSCAVTLKQQHPKAKILILEKGILPQGASTKNAGFACFGSLSEILDDLTTHSEDDVLKLVEKRLNGLQLLKDTLGENNIGYKKYGGYELFSKADTELFDQCMAQKDNINNFLKPLFKANVFTSKANPFQFKNVNNTFIFNAFEGQIDTGKMMSALLKKTILNDIKILNNITVESFIEDTNSVKIKTNAFELETSKLCIATNGFAKQLLNKNVKPARAQVLITEPIKNLTVKGTFHLNKGYNYFRNIDDRILIGGGRDLDFKTEETTEFGQTQLIQNHLEDLLSSIILPNTPFKIEQRWSGIMGVGEQKKPIVKPISNRVFCGVRLGGMGIAIGSSVGRDLANLTRNA